MSNSEASSSVVHSSVMTSGSQRFHKLSSCNLPTELGLVQMCVYGVRGGPNWVVCISGAVRGQRSVHLRVHDACLTSEVLGSLKCDCALQLKKFRQHIAVHGGVLIYTPQEGRGIGLANKVAAYALQEHGLDTVDANIALGLPEEAREYSCVATILRDLGIESVVLLTNNPYKLRCLRALGVVVESAASILPDGLPEQCVGYLLTKAERMGHMLPANKLQAGMSSRPSPLTNVVRHDLRTSSSRAVNCGAASSTSAAPSTEHRCVSAGVGTSASDRADVKVREGLSPLPVEVLSLLRCLGDEIVKHEREGGGRGSRRLPYVTLTYAQTLDGSIAGPQGASGERLILSGEQSMTMTHALRALHDAIVVGVGTAIADNPQLTVRLTPGKNPLRVLLDGSLRVPPTSRMLRADSSSSSSTTAAVISRHRTLCTSAGAERAAQLRSHGVRLLALAADEDGQLPLSSALSLLAERLRVRSVMIEGGTEVIASCAREQAAHRVVLTLAPKLTHGTRPAFHLRTRSASSFADAACKLHHVHSFCLGDDVVISGQGPAMGYH